MEAARIQPGAVVKVVAISLVVIAVAVLLALAAIRIETTLIWLFAAIFLAMAMSPAVELVERPRLRGRGVPRWLAILFVYIGFLVLFVFVVLHVIPPIVDEVEQLGSQLPAYISDFEDWASESEQFRELNAKYDLTDDLSAAAKELPARLGDAAKEVQAITVSAIEHFVAAITVLTIAFFLLLDGGRQLQAGLDRLPASAAERSQRAAGRIYGVVRSYVSVNLSLAVAAGVFTWGVLELLGVDLAVPLGVLMVFFDLVPLVGLTVGGLLVAVVAALHDFPEALIVWVVAFVAYQQIQDRVVQPLLYRSAVRVHPVVAIVAILIGAELLGILGALLAIPVAASIGVVVDETLGYRRESAGAPPGEPAPSAAGSAD